MDRETQFVWLNALNSPLRLLWSAPITSSLILPRITGNDIRYTLDTPYTLPVTHS